MEPGRCWVRGRCSVQSVHCAVPVPVPVPVHIEEVQASDLTLQRIATKNRGIKRETITNKRQCSSPKSPKMKAGVISIRSLAGKEALLSFSRVCPVPFRVCLAEAHTVATREHCRAEASRSAQISEDCHEAPLVGRLQGTLLDAVCRETILDLALLEGLAVEPCLPTPRAKATSSWDPAVSRPKLHEAEIGDWAG
ncbi:expressed unknown protein [Seminavis robusta]|uniref:Uncharacterized protein n=1 Tax=Seminavis robusta TaxID=568900 RepID=A0A9N8D7G5_9STRA|nr:expressed unknown protein [Seminavis robusta]|eukprot:Sro20_g014461.1  (195) ;mRNA; r:178045-178629